MANNKSHLQKLALDLYILHDGNISEVARDARMPSRVTLQKWKKDGLPKRITKGLDWDEYRIEHQEKTRRQIQVKQANEQDDFLTEARDTIKDVFRSIKIAIDSGDFEAKPADLEKMMKLYLTLDTRDEAQQTWMQAMMVKVLTIIADVVTPEQFTLVRQRFLDLERNEAAKLDLVVDRGVPNLPTAEETVSSKEEDEYVDFTETS